MPRQSRKRSLPIHRPLERCGVSFDGLDIVVYRSLVDGRIVIELDTSDLEERDTFPPHDVPNLVLYVNEERNETTAAGGWRTADETES